MGVEFPQHLEAAHVTAIDSPLRRATFRVLMFALLLEPVIVLGVLVVLGVPWWAILGVCALGLALVDRDGRFLTIQPTARTDDDPIPSGSIVVVQNWDEELKGLVPVK